MEIIGSEIGAREISRIAAAIERYGNRSSRSPVSPTGTVSALAHNPPRTSSLRIRHSPSGGGPDIAPPVGQRHVSPRPCSAHSREATVIVTVTLNESNNPPPTGAAE